ncbi:MAG: hypothetical protein Q9164_003980 [Protoblastenia rupestris]
MHALIPFVAAGFAMLAIREIFMVVYRLFFHPLARVPGPMLASATQWYEFYYDILNWPGGQYWYEVDKMHERYGPIVRVTPHEVHIKDPGWFDQLYCAASEGSRDKYQPSAHMTGTPEGIFGTVHHEVHRKRRAAISPFFSKRAITEIEPWIHEKAELLFAGMRMQQQCNGSVDLRVNFLAMTTDMIAALSLNGSNPPKRMHLLQNEEYAREWQKTIAAVAFLTPIAKQFPWLIPTALKFPVGFWTTVAPPLGRIVELNRDMRRSAQLAIDEESSSVDTKIEVESPQKPVKHHNIFHTILNSSLPPPEKTEKRMGQEGFVAIAAGGETCGRMMTLAIYYVLADKDRLMPMLMQELVSVMPTTDIQPQLKALEQLPWLTGIIRETLRLSTLLTSRLPLVSPDRALQYRDHVIPPSHPVSMSLRHIMHDPSIFSDPLAFRPERWLPTNDNPDLEKINRFYVPFGRGTRNCIGINLAYAQLYIVLARVLRMFELDLYDVVYERDVQAVRDCFIGEPMIGSPGVRVTIKEASF